jgi:flagellar protein FliT
MEASDSSQSTETICRRWPSLVSAVSDFYQTTLQLIHLLENEKSNDRDGKIHTIQALLEKREGFMQEMTPPFSLSDQEIGRQLVKLNQTVKILLESEKTSIQQDINKTRKKKQTATKYNNPYDSLSTMDGVFYDKRK